MKKILVSGLCVCGAVAVAVAAGTLRSAATPLAPLGEARVASPVQAPPVTGAGLNKMKCQTETDSEQYELDRQALCKLIRVFDGCENLPVTHKAYIDCCTPYTSYVINDEMTAVTGLYASKGVPSGLTDTQVADALTAISALQGLLSGTLADDIDPDLAKAFLVTLASMQKDFGG